MSEIQANKISPATGTTFTLGDSGDTFNIPSGATIANAGTATGFGGDNTPSFCAFLSADQSISSGTETKIQFNTEVFDTDNAYDNSSNYRFTVPSGKAGRYYFHANVHSDFSGIGDDGERALLYFYKDGSSKVFNDFFIGSSYNVVQVSNAYSFIIDLNAGEYIELYIMNKDGNAGGNAEVGAGSFFMGYRLA